MRNKKVIISCGPIPARLDSVNSVKFLTSRYKGGLAFKTAAFLADQCFKLTVVVWKGTKIPANLRNNNIEIVRVEDVFDYYRWFEDNASGYDACIMAAAVANLTPSHPHEGKFPLHNYKVGEKFNIEFEIAPRAIDVVKKVNPRCCLIGYKRFDAQTDEELIEIARHTQADAKANIIFASTPATAKDRKIAVMADNTALPCTFDEHLQLIKRAIMAEYFRTEIEPLTEEERNNPDIREALATVKMFEKTFSGGGAVAVPVNGLPSLFATTSRGHRGEPVIVRNVDIKNSIITATAKATLSVPTLWTMLRLNPHRIVVHRHTDDALYEPDSSGVLTLNGYLFPGTKEEVLMLDKYACPFSRFKFKGHGDIQAFPIHPASWYNYYQDFPGKYTPIPDEMQQLLADADSLESLEIGGSHSVCTKYAYDAFVNARNVINLSWAGVMKTHFDLVVAKNSINHFAERQICAIMERTDQFIANTFLVPPEEIVTDREAAVLDKELGMIRHTLHMPDDSIIRNSFYAYTQEDYERMGFEVTPYGKNSALLKKKD